MVDSSGVHVDPVHSIDILLGLNGAKVISGHCGGVGTPN